MRRSNGSIVTRSVVKSCRSPPYSIPDAARATSVSNAADQSSSVPRSSPIRWVRAMPPDDIPAATGSAPGVGEQIDQEGVERVAPGDVVVGVAVDVQRRRVTLAPQRGRHGAVVRQVLLRRAAGERDRDGGGDWPRIEHLAHEPRDPAEAGEAGLVAVPA